MTNRFENYALVIDTDSYAGNFEREMTAYLTGATGECGVGGEFVDMDVEEVFEDIIDQVPDDNGCYRPTSCYSSPNSKENNSVAIFFTEEPTKQQVILIKERLKTFNEAYKTIGGMAQFRKDNPDIQILGLRIIKKDVKLNERVLT